jgi:hypothetical protein
VSCCMRDAVTLEALGIPTAIIVNDVFEPIAHATSALLRLPDDYVAKNVVWLPHPTSNLTDARAAALIDDRIDAIRDVLLGRTRVAAVAPPAPREGAPDRESLEAARTIVHGLAESLRADGADLVLSHFEDGTLAGELRIGELTCDDGSCIMPTDALERMVEAMVRPKIASLRGVPTNRSAQHHVSHPILNCF